MILTIYCIPDAKLSWCQIFECGNDSCYDSLRCWNHSFNFVVPQSVLCMISVSHVPGELVRGCKNNFLIFSTYVRLLFISTIDFGIWFYFGNTGGWHEADVSTPEVVKYFFWCFFDLYLWMSIFNPIKYKERPWRFHFRTISVSTSC